MLHKTMEVIRIIAAFAVIGCVFGAVFILKAADAKPWNDFGLAGKGTRKEPFLIENAEELTEFAAQVNAGHDFNGVYFRQVNDIDLGEYGNWVPIGTYDCGYEFRGVYDGAGHTISNLHSSGNELSHGNVGLFGKLGGVVCNLGIESGKLEGAFIGSFASHSVGESAQIINCYSKADLKASGRCGGIADNFGAGKIIGCVFAGTFDAEGEAGGIVSYTAGSIIGCYANLQLINEQFDGEIKDSFLMNADDVKHFMNLPMSEMKVDNLDEDYLPDLYRWE